MKAFKITSIILIFLVFLSCSNSSKIKIGYLVPNLQSGRYAKEEQYFKEKIEQLGGEAFLASAEYDGKLQIQQAHEMLEKGAKALVVNSVNMNTAAAIVRDAHEHGAKVMAYDRIIRNSDLDYYISFDNTKVGEYMAQYALKYKPSGNYMLLGGDKNDMNAVLVKNGQLNALKKAISDGSVKVIYDIFVEDWSTENAYHEMKSYLQLSDVLPDVILSSYDGMSFGAIKALKENNNDVSTMIITGQDAELFSLKSIVNNEQTMTVYKPLKAMAYKAAELSFAMASNEKIEKPAASISNGQKEVPAILLDPIVVDKNNIKTTIISDGFFKESDIYSN